MIDQDDSARFKARIQRAIDRDTGGQLDAQQQLGETCALCGRLDKLVPIGYQSLAIHASEADCHDG